MADVEWIDISAMPNLPWTDVLELFAECIKRHIKPEITGAKVYPFWVYEIDVATLLGKVVPQMLATEGTSEGKVHCWTLGISTAAPVLNQQGDTPLVGTQAYEWIITADVWGFWSYEGTRASQKQAIDEARLVGAALKRNALPMVEATEKLSVVKELSFTALQPVPFSDGYLYSVASGQMQFRVNEHFTE